MKKIWLVLIFLLNLAPNIMDGKLTLTCMNNAMAQMMGDEYICEDEWGDPFPSDVDCDYISCTTACPLCNDSYGCNDSHVCETEFCNNCMTSYYKGENHTCEPTTCLRCNAEYFPKDGHMCTANNPPTTPGTGGNNGGAGGNGQGSTNPKPSSETLFINKIYNNNSSLTSEQKRKLTTAIGDMLKNDYYKKILNYIAEKEVSLTFKIEGSITGRAYVVNGTMKFSCEEYIKSDILREEFIHLAQNLIYGDEMTSKYKNYELEAQIIADMIYASDQSQSTIHSAQNYFFTFNQEGIEAYNRLISMSSVNKKADFELVCDIYYYQTLTDNIALDCKPDFSPDTYIWIINQ